MWGLVELLCVALATVLVVGVAAVGLGLLAFQARREWVVEVAGRHITLRNRLFSEELLIDGQPVKAAVTHRTMWSRVLSCEFEGKDGRPHQLMASLEPSGGLGVAGHLFVDGTFVGGDPIEGPGPGPTSAPITEPDDARWRAARQLVSGITTHGGQDARDAAGKIEVAIRASLADLAHLDEVRGAHQTVAELAGDGGERLDGVFAVQEERVRVLLSTLADLHLATLARTGTAGTDDAVGRARDVLGKLSADAEVDRAVKERAARTAAIQDRARQRS